MLFLVTILLFLLTLGGWYLFQRWRAEQYKREAIRSLLPEMALAMKEMAASQNLSLYFSNYTAQQLGASHDWLLQSIPKNYQSCGLDGDEQALIARLVSSHEQLEVNRLSYNKRFVASEIEHLGRTYFEIFKSAIRFKSSIKKFVKDLITSTKRDKSVFTLFVSFFILRKSLLIKHIN